MFSDTRAGSSRTDQEMTVTVQGSGVPQNVNFNARLIIFLITTRFRITNRFRRGCHLQL